MIFLSAKIEEIEKKRPKNGLFLVQNEENKLSQKLTYRRIWVV